MRGVSELLKMANAHIDGLQDPILQINHTWKNPTSDFIQIFNKDDCHWVTLSSIGMPEGSVAVYDSLHGTTFSTSFKRDIAYFCRPSGDKLLLHTMNVQRQRDSFSCGIHAAAFAASLAHGQDPCELRYYGAGKHLRDGLCKGQLMPFPADVSVNHKRIISTLTLEILCVCHGIDDSSPMIECQNCNQWFHRHCVHTEDNEVEWHCGQCKHM